MPVLQSGQKGIDCVYMAFVCIFCFIGLSKSRAVSFTVVSTGFRFLALTDYCFVERFLHTSVT